MQWSAVNRVERTRICVYVLSVFCVNQRRIKKKGTPWKQENLFLLSSILCDQHFSGKFASLISDCWLKFLQWCTKQRQWQPYLFGVLGKHHGLSTTCQCFCFQNLLHISRSSPSWCVSVPAECACCDDKRPQNVANVAHVGDDGGEQWRRGGAGAGRRQRCYRWSGKNLACVLHRSSV